MQKSWSDAQRSLRLCLAHESCCPDDTRCNPAVATHSDSAVIFRTQQLASLVPHAVTQLGAPCTRVGAALCHTRISATVDLGHRSSVCLMALSACLHLRSFLGYPCMGLRIPRAMCTVCTASASARYVHSWVPEGPRSWVRPSPIALPRSDASQRCDLHGSGFVLGHLCRPERVRGNVDEPPTAPHPL